MLIVAICAIIGLLFGIVSFWDEKSIRALVGILLGACSGLLSFIIILIVSLCCYGSDSMYHQVSETQELTPYVVDESNYYVYINNDNDISVNIQYYDDNCSPQSISITSSFDITYQNGATPEVIITRTVPDTTLWLLNVGATRYYYEIVVANEKQVYSRF